MTTNQIIKILKKESNPDKILFKETKFGITSNNALGMVDKNIANGKLNNSNYWMKQRNGV